MKQTNSLMISRVFTAITVVALVFALNVTGALAGFWRTIDGITSSGVSNPAEFLYGIGTDGTTNGIFGYGYGYGYGSFDDGFVEETTTSEGTNASSGGNIPNVNRDNNVNGGGGSSSSGGGSSSSNNNDNDNGSSTNNNDRTTSPDNTNNNTSNQNSDVSGTDSNDTVREEGACNFPDIRVRYDDTGNNWARSYIRDLSKRGIMNGVQSSLLDPEGSFEPNRAVTRIEFLKIALRAFCYEYSTLSGNENFADVVDGSWQAKVVELAGAIGVIDTNNANFRPNEAVSKIEALKMILLVGSTRSNNFTVDQNVTTSTFGDVTVEWMAKYVEKARMLDMVAGNNGNFEPMAALSRAQAAKIAVRAMNAQ